MEINTGKNTKTNQRFSYVAYDDTSKQKQETFKEMFQSIENYAELALDNGRAKSLLMTALEEAYMWTGKAIRDEQIERNSQVEHVPGRTNE